MLSSIFKKTILLLAFLLVSTSLFAQPTPKETKPEEAPLYNGQVYKDEVYENQVYFEEQPSYKGIDLIQDESVPKINVDEAVQEKLAEFEKMVRDNVKSQINLKFINDLLPAFMEEYSIYLNKYYTTVNALDPVILIEDLPRADQILKEKFGWTTYDLLLKHEELSQRLENEILPYIEAEVYEREWGLGNTSKENANKGTDIEKSKARNQKEGSFESHYDYDHMKEYLETAEQKILKYKTKWEESQKTILKNLDNISKTTRSYAYGETTVWEETQADGSKIFIAGEKEKVITDANFKEYSAEGLKYPTVDQGLGIAAKHIVETLKNAILVEDLHSVFLLERSLIVAGEQLTELNATHVNLLLLKDVISAYRENPERFNKFVESAGIKRPKEWMEHSFEQTVGLIEFVLDQQDLKAKANKFSIKTFGGQVLGSSINMMLAASISETFFMALDQSSSTKWAVPDSEEKEKIGGYKTNTFLSAQHQAYTSIETWVGLLTFTGTTNTINYAGLYLIKGWEENWANKSLIKNSKFAFVTKNANKLVRQLKKSSIFETVRRTKISTKLNNMFKSTMYTSFKTGTAGFTKETFKLVKGFGSMSLGFALGQKFSQYVVARMLFSKELSLPDDDPVKIKTLELIHQMSWSAGANAETTNVAISLFLSEILINKALVVPKYYSIMKELNKNKCKITYSEIKKIFERNRLLKEIKINAKTGFFNKAGRTTLGWGTGLGKLTVLFTVQRYIDELVVSKLLFKDLIEENKQQVLKLQIELLKTEIVSLLIEMVKYGDIQYIEQILYPNYNEYVTLKELIAPLKTKRDDVLCCLSHLDKQELASKASNKTRNQKAYDCLKSLVGNILDPVKNLHSCDPAKTEAKNQIDAVISSEYLTETQKQIIIDNQDKIVAVQQKGEEADNIVALIEKANFTKAKEMINSGDYEASVKSSLINAIDEIATGYSNMTAQSATVMIRKLFLETYPNIIGTETDIDLNIRKDVLNALTAVVYFKFKTLAPEQAVMNGIYNLLDNGVLLMPETYPGHKSSIYNTLARLGFTGIHTSEAGVTDIKNPNEVKPVENKDTNKTKAIPLDQVPGYKGPINIEENKQPEKKENQE